MNQRPPPSRMERQKRTVPSHRHKAQQHHLRFLSLVLALTPSTTSALWLLISWVMFRPHPIRYSTLGTFTYQELVPIRSPKHPRLLHFTLMIRQPAGLSMASPTPMARSRTLKALGPPL